MKVNLLVIFISISAFSYGQDYSSDFNFTLSEPHTEVAYPDKHYFASEGGLISLKIHGKKSKFQKYSGPKLNESFRSEEQLLTFGYNHIDFLEMDERLYHVYMTYDRETSATSVMAREIDLDNGGYLREEKELFKESGYDAYRTHAQLCYLFDGDSKVKVISYRVMSTGETKKLKIYTFDHDLEMVDEEVKKIAFSKKTDGALVSAVDDHGNMYYASLIMTKEDLKRGEDQVFNVEMISSPHGVEEFISYVFDAPGAYIGSVRFKEIEGTGIMTTVGTYRDNKEDGARGVFVNVMAADGSLKKQLNVEFSEKILFQAIDEKRKAKMLKSGFVGIKNLVVNRVTPESDGSITVHCAIEKLGEVMNKDDYILINMTMEGDLNWIKRLPRKKYASPIRFGQLGAMLFDIDDYFIETENSYFYLFTDNPDNATLGMEDSPKVHKGWGGELVAYKVDRATGDSQKMLLMNVNDANGVKLKELYLGERVIDLGEGYHAVEAFKIPNQKVVLKFHLED